MAFYRSDRADTVHIVYALLLAVPRTVVYSKFLCSARSQMVAPMVASYRLGTADVHYFATIPRLRQVRAQQLLGSAHDPHQRRAHTVTSRQMRREKEPAHQKTTSWMIQLKCTIAGSNPAPCT